MASSDSGCSGCIGVVVFLVLLVVAPWLLVGLIALALVLGVIKALVGALQGNENDGSGGRRARFHDESKRYSWVASELSKRKEPRKDAQDGEGCGGCSGCLIIVLIVFVLSAVSSG